MKNKTFSSTELTILYQNTVEEGLIYKDWKDDISEGNYNVLMEYVMEEPDKDTGSFDSKKGAMYDFEIVIYHIESGARYIGEGGYYTHNGTEFNNDIRFEKVIIEKINPTYLKDLDLNNPLHFIIASQDTCKKGHFTISISDAIDAAKEYAKLYINKASEEAECEEDAMVDLGHTIMSADVNKDSILKLLKEIDND